MTYLPETQSVGEGLLLHGDRLVVRRLVIEKLVFGRIRSEFIDAPRRLEHPDDDLEHLNNR